MLDSLRSPRRLRVPLPRLHRWRAAVRALSGDGAEWHGHRDIARVESAECLGDPARIEPGVSSRLGGCGEGCRVPGFDDSTAVSRRDGNFAPASIGLTAARPLRIGPVAHRRTGLSFGRRVRVGGCVPAGACRVRGHVDCGQLSGLLRRHSDVRCGSGVVGDTFCIVTNSCARTQRTVRASGYIIRPTYLRSCHPLLRHNPQDQYIRPSRRPPRFSPLPSGNIPSQLPHPRQS